MSADQKGELPSIVEALEFRRNQYGLTQTEWATVLGMGQSHYSEFVSGERSLPKHAMAAAFHYGVPAECLFQCRPDKGYTDALHVLGKTRNDHT